MLHGRAQAHSGPVGAGKSAVAEILTLCRWDQTGKAALYVLPYVALCEQKAQSLTKLLEPLGRYNPCTQHCLPTPQLSILSVLLHEAPFYLSGQDPHQGSG